MGPLLKTAPTVRVRESFNISHISLLIVLQIIYVTRNPKDVMVSYYHFSKFISSLEEIPDFNLFMERFLAGKGRIPFLEKSPNSMPRPQIEWGLVIRISINYQSPLPCCNLNPKLQRLSELDTIF